MSRLYPHINITTIPNTVELQPQTWKHLTTQEHPFDLWGLIWVVSGGGASEGLIGVNDGLELGEEEW